MSKERIIYLDVIRVLACMMVIVHHSPMPEGVNSVLLSATGFLTYPCCPLFFMISGALLLPIEPNTTSIFLKKRFVKFISPTLLWTLFYFIVGVVKNDPVSFKSLFSIPFSVRESGILWFMYILISLYLVIPIISPWLMTVSKKGIKLFLFLWGITLLFSHINKFLLVDMGYNNMLYYFGGYLGYLVLGYYLHHFVKVSERVLLEAVVLFIVPVVIYGICKYTGMEFVFSAYTSILTALMSAAWFLGIKCFHEIYPFTSVRIRSLLESISKLSFGIYLVHIILLTDVSWRICELFGIKSLAQIIVTSVLTLLLSIITCIIIGRLPISQYLIGYSFKK